MSSERARALAAAACILVGGSCHTARAAMAAQGCAIPIGEELVDVRRLDRSIRVEAAGGGVVAYSCDTNPSPEITALAAGADILVHEAQQQRHEGVHSTYAQAAEVAFRAGARRLVLVHLPPGVTDADLADARRIFEHTELGEDGARYEF